MKVIQYTTHYDTNRVPTLVRERSGHYPELSKNLSNPQLVANLMNSVFSAPYLTEEYAWILALSTSSTLIGIFEVSHGTINQTLIGMREIFSKLCLVGAANFIFCHNHPSKNPLPSTMDMSLTKRLKECAELMDIPLLDHIILSDDFYSFREHSLIIE